MNENVIHVMVVEANPVIRNGLMALLNMTAVCRVVEAAADGSEALSIAESVKPDIILFDLDVVRASGVEVIAEMRRRSSCSEIIITTTFEGESALQDSLRAGARGYLLKGFTAEELLSAIRHAYRGNLHAA